MGEHPGVRGSSRERSHKIVAKRHVLWGSSRNHAWPTVNASPRHLGDRETFPGDAHQFTVTVEAQLSAEQGSRSFTFPEADPYNLHDVLHHLMPDLASQYQPQPHP